MNIVKQTKQIEILNKDLHVKSLPLNCSESMKNLNYVPAPIEFNSGPEVPIGSSYRSFFLHKHEQDCKIENCGLMSENCKDQGNFDELTTGRNPMYQIFANG